MQLCDLSAGDYFRFVGCSLIWEYRGNSWYACPCGYDGGPWHGDATMPVELYTGVYADIWAKNEAEPIA